MKIVSCQQHLRVVALLALALVVCMMPARSAPGGQRDHLTPAEADLVRDAQAIDRRTDVFIKAAERRLLLLTDPQAAQTLQAQQANKKDKDKELWGELPTGTRAQLLGDLAGIFDEAITNIDDVAERDAKSSLLHGALRKLAAAATRFQPQLRSMRDNATDNEREALDNTLSELQEIIDAAQKLPADAETKKAKP
jgi:hypothetical protein